MTLSTKILLSYLALGGGVGGIYIGVNGGIGNKAIKEIEEISEPVEAPNAVEPEVKAEKTEESVEEKIQDIVVKETPKAKANKESATIDEEIEQAEITDNNENAGQKTDLKLQTIEVRLVPTVEIQVAQAVPEIKKQALTVKTNLVAPEKTTENAKPEPIEAPVSNQTTPKTKEKAAGANSSSEGSDYGIGWIVDLAKGYAEQRNQVTNIIETIRQSLN